jgi:menaquinone-dependent protoporphyrinogen oxidase
VKVLVAVGSRLGSTAAIAERIGGVLRDSGVEVSVQPAAVAGPVDDYDAFVIGGGTYGGRWHADAVAFIRRHAELLVERPVWLFSSGPLGATSAAKAREPVEIAELAPLVKARGHAVFAGAHDRKLVDGSDLSRLEKFIAKRFITEGDWRDWSSIEAWARAIAREVRPIAITAL